MQCVPAGTASAEIIDAFIDFLLQTEKNSKTQSKTKLPCTYCGLNESTTWRPGPCGPSTLCNKCGVMYMDSGKRNRQIDLVYVKNTAMWVKKDATSWMWKEDREAPSGDHRVQMWVQRETTRHKLQQDLNPKPHKRMRL